MGRLECQVYTVVEAGVSSGEVRVSSVYGCGGWSVKWGG